ncbi:hypothetical protein INR49_021401, partial [Caranx melampygus]
MLDRQTGVWLSHSTPRFPTYRSRNFWPKNGNVNAQTFLCMTYSYNDFKEIGLQLKYIHAYSYDYDLPATFPKDLRCVAQRSCYPKKEPWFRVKPLTSVGGHQFYSFAKYKRFGDDLYSSLIVNSLKQDLYVKSWGKMRRPLPSNCTIPHHVYNVNDVQSPDTKHISDTIDHSKWCVTLKGKWTCIADMNRAVSQMGRGGGAICTKDAAVWMAFYDLVQWKSVNIMVQHAQQTNLYSGLITEKLDNDLFVKSWGKMHRPLPSNCSIPHHVYNVRVVHLSSSHAFSDTVDHSKWCVAPDGGWTCIADMNREMSQMDRGGGAICIENSRIARAFTHIIKWYDPCNPVPLPNP